MPTQTTATRPFLKVKDLAERWGTTPNAIYQMRARGDGPPATLIGRELLFAERAVEDFEQQRTERPKPAA